jgi:hypothetical protein
MIMFYFKGVLIKTEQGLNNIYLNKNYLTSFNEDNVAINLNDVEVIKCKRKLTIF